MGFINWLLGFRKKGAALLPIGWATGYDSVKAYEHELGRAMIDTVATHTAKATAMHVVLDGEERIKEVKRNSVYAALLNRKPNEIMTGFDLKYKLFSQREQHTTAFCYVNWDGLSPASLVPLDYDKVKILENEESLVAEIMLGGGTVKRVLVDDLVVLRKLFGKSEFYGDGNSPIHATLGMLKAVDEGNLQSLQVSNKIRGLLKQKKAMLSGDDVEKATEDFTRRFNAAAKSGGIVGIDSMEDYTEIKTNALMAGADHVKEIKANLNRYWHVCEPILLGDYSDTQYQAFYESVVEPALLQASQAFTNAFFTPREQAHGNRIIFYMPIMTNASVQTKTNVIKATREIGLFTKNEYRSWFGVAPVEDGDKFQISLNYVDEKNQDKYQIGSADKNDEGDKNEESEGSETTNE